jgi:hypothetical protein
MFHRGGYNRTYVPSGRLSRRCGVTDAAERAGELAALHLVFLTGLKNGVPRVC